MATITIKTAARNFLGKTSSTRVFCVGDKVIAGVPATWSDDFAEKAADIASSSDFDSLHAACGGIEHFDADLFGAAHSLLELTV